MGIERRHTTNEGHAAFIGVERIRGMIKVRT